MTQINDNFLKLPGSYLFAEIANRVDEYKKNNPNKKVISLGIGDITQPLAPAVISAMHKAVEEMGNVETVRGYAPYEGYDFLIHAIWENDYKARGIQIREKDIFISDGAKSDTGNIVDILGDDNIVALTDPVYPVYVDSNAMAGRAGDYVNDAWNRIVYLPCNAANGFVPELPNEKVDIVYLCYPNNPTGTTLTKEQLKVWVDYAREKKVLIMYDGAYKAFISEADVPHSIYEIEGAKEVAVEFRSFSKTAGFTGVRCGYTVIPEELKIYDKRGNLHALNKLWARRQSTKFNGTCYIAQRGAEAVFTEEGKVQTQATIDYYMENARLIKTGLESLGMTVYGGVNAPYIWLKTPEGMDSWKMFGRLLNEIQLVTTPGVGFGKSGEGFIRLTAFGNREDVKEAVERIKNWKL